MLVSCFLIVCLMLLSCIFGIGSNFCVVVVLVSRVYMR